MPGSASFAGSRRQLNGIAEIRTFFRTNSQPIYFVGPTAFNLLGIDRWVRNFQYIAYYDSWDGQHPRVFTPENRPYVEFESSEQINNYLRCRDRHNWQVMSLRDNSEQDRGVGPCEGSHGGGSPLRVDLFRQRAKSSAVRCEPGQQLSGLSMVARLGIEKSEKRGLRRPGYSFIAAPVCAR